jgi:L-amino acid N-acyltransferase YncA
VKDWRPRSADLSSGRSAFDRSAVSHWALAGIALPNDASVALHDRFGFRRVGHVTEQGWKFGHYWDVAWHERAVE